MFRDNIIKNWLTKSRNVLVNDRYNNMFNRPTL